MDIKQMTYFVTIVEQGTISQAAKKLHMTQPPLSLQIHQLEEEIGTPLLIRHPRHIACTEAGQILYQRAKTILKYMQATQDELNNHIEGLSGHLRIGIISSVHEYVLQQWILPFHTQNPQLQFDLCEGNTFELIERVVEGSLDCAFVRSPFSCPNSIDVRGLMDEELCVVGLEKKIVHITDLKPQPLLIYRRWKSLIDDAFAKHNLQPFYQCICDDARTCLRLCESGLGIAITPRSSLCHLPSSFPVSRLDIPSFSTEVCLISHRLYPHTRSVQLFLEQHTNQ